MECVLDLLPIHISKAMKSSDLSIDEVDEIRLAVGKPVLVIGGEEAVITRDRKPLLVTKDDIEEVIGKGTQYSLYLKEDEINQGYISVDGGYRIGVCGTVTYRNNEIYHHGSFTSVNIRCPKEVIGCGEKLIKEIAADNTIKNTIIIAPPKRGKTTLLRDLVRLLSNTYKLRVGVIDERSELYGTGKFDLGIRSDILCGCKKADGVLMMIRTMSPDVIVVDELGGQNDIDAILFAKTCGVAVIGSIHGISMLDIQNKGLAGAFDLYIMLGNNRGEFSICKGVNDL